MNKNSLIKNLRALKSLTGQLPGDIYSNAKQALESLGYSEEESKDAAERFTKASSTTPKL